MRRTPPQLRELGGSPGASPEGSAHRSGARKAARAILDEIAAATASAATAAAPHAAGWGAAPAAGSAADHDMAMRHGGGGAGAAGAGGAGWAGREDPPSAPGRGGDGAWRPPALEARRGAAQRGAAQRSGLGLFLEGSKVTGALPGSPSHRAGLREGDQVRAVNGAAVNNHTCKALLQARAPRPCALPGGGGGGGGGGLAGQSGAGR